MNPPPPKKTVYVAGGSGYLGARLLTSMTQKPLYEPVCLSRNTKNIQTLLPHVRCLSFDLQKSEFPTFIKADTLVHLAGLGYNDCEQDPERTYAINVEGTEQLARWAVEQRIKHVIFVSTIHVYGFPLSGRIVETRTPQPLSNYAKQRLAAEKRILEVLRETDTKVTIFRLSNGIGLPLTAHGWDLIGNFLCHSAVHAEKIVLNSDGLGERDFIPVKAITDTIERFIENPEAGVFNLGSGTTLRIMDLVHLIREIYEKATGHNLYVETGRFSETRGHEPLMFDCTKLADKRDFTYELRQELQQTIMTLVKQDRLREKI